MSTATIHVRPATPADAGTIVAFNCAMAAESEGRTLDEAVVRRAVQRELDKPSLASYFVAECDGQVVGQLMLTREFSDWRDGEFWWIQSVFVRVDARRRGVYRTLHQHVEQLARRTPGVCGLRLYVDRRNVRAQETYRALGMSVTEYDLYEVDWHADPHRA